MKFLSIKTLSALSLSVLLAACGGYQPDESVQATGTAAAPTATTGMPTTVVTAGTVGTAVPAPDCAAEGCKGPRIIDANAEAYRYDAMRRAGAPQS